jgi:hypothetical protein
MFERKELKMTRKLNTCRDAGRRARWALLSVALVAALVAALGGASTASATAGVTTDLYPNLRMLSPSNLHLLTWDVGGQQHQQIHFTSRIWNAGPGALEIQRVPTTSGIADLNQRIYESPAGFHDVKLGQVVFDPTDFTFPVPDIARYEVWTKRGYNRAKARGFKRGRPLAERLNISHCVADGYQFDPNSAPQGTYAICTKVLMGISVGWADVEDYFNETQSVDFGTALPPDGDYVLRVIVDPDNLIHESPGKADPARESEIANSAVSYFRLVQGHLAGTE